MGAAIIAPGAMMATIGNAIASIMLPITIANATISVPSETTATKGSTTANVTIPAPIADAMISVPGEMMAATVSAIKLPATNTGTPILRIDLRFDILKCGPVKIQLICLHTDYKL